ncbi:MAG TPA: NADH-quinone oxidoreductase subunit C [Planctomycetaceae bacterium]|nr:NADH-quinone oxidoreductase subunit C [Planctomycetaceae bacterium]
MQLDELLAKLSERFDAERFQSSQFRDNRRIVCPAQLAYELLQYLKEDCGFDMLVDVTAIDYSQYPRSMPGRFCLLYSLASTTANERLFVQVYLQGDSPSVRSVTALWHAANWLEREVYDMFGIRFEGHPNLRRILLPEAFGEHPLRKDYPLRGRGERHNFPVITREREERAAGLDVH